MTHPSQAIEVEIVEIDGAVPTATFDRRSTFPPSPSWQDWQGRIRRLDSRWWPLWVILGSVAVMLLLTVGVVLGLVIVIFRMIRAMLRGIFR